LSKNSKLNSQQREAVRYVGGPLLVLAGAGSGKTSVITEKIAYLIDQCGLKASQIVAVTFTNKAAREMKERVSRLLKGRNARGLTVSTFHTLGLNIIRKEHTLLGYRKGFSIYDSQDSKSLLKDLLIREFSEATDDVGQIQTKISEWKNALVTPEKAIQMSSDQDELFLARLYEQYNIHLSAYNAVDFDDLITLPALVFKRHPEILQKWRARIRYLLVDEYQDTNLSQYELVRQLVAEHKAVTVVGDDDQSIYAWRGARPENLIKLQQDFPDLKVIKLEQNYRSTARILKAANTLIANNPHIFDKALWSELGLGDEIRLIQVRNEDAEAERIAAEILDCRLQKKARFKDVAVLYRGNHQARLLEIKLQAYQIPYQLSGGTSFFSRTEIKDAMAYLRLLVNPDDDAAFLRIVNVPRREIGPVTLEHLARIAEQNNISLFAAIQADNVSSGLREKSLTQLRDFAHTVMDTAQKCAQHEAIPVLKQFFTGIDYEAWLQQNSTSGEQAARGMGNIWLLLEQLGRMLENDPLDDQEARTLNEAIANLVLRDILEQQNEQAEEDKVHLLTMHASKGLEFPHVFLMGLEEDILPHRNSIDNDQIEEERRLLYVGITRAQKNLTMTYCEHRKQFGEKIEVIPSRFLDELPEDDIHAERLGHSSPERNKVKGKATLAALFRDLAEDS